jgi:hypothetical protein
VVAAGQQLEAGGGVAPGHFASVQHFVPLGDDGQVALRPGVAGRLRARNSSCR